MTTLTSEQRAAVEDPITEFLTRIVDLALDMTATEREAALNLFAEVSLKFAMTASDAQIPAAEMVSKLARVIKTIDSAHQEG